MELRFPLAEAAEGQEPQQTGWAPVAAAGASPGERRCILRDSSPQGGPSAGPPVSPAVGGHGGREGA